MSKRAFSDEKMTKKTLEYINQINNILSEYVKDHYTLTLRQLYYQLVASKLGTRCARTKGFIYNA